jgi:CTP synthase
LAAKYCREEKVPFLGICLGFQAMVVEYARNILNWKDANSTEFDENVSKPVIMFMPEIDKDNMGGTMRLGSRATRFTHTADDYSMSVSQCLYLLAPEHGNDGIIWERHRHRYEVNPEFVDEVHDAGLKFVARDADSGTRMEIAELSTREHPYYIGCQYHPEFQSREMHPSPLFLGLILACCGNGALETYLTEAKAQADGSLGSKEITR